MDTFDVFKNTDEKIVTSSFSGYGPNMSEAHAHEWFEISIIRQGRVKILLSATVDEGDGERIMVVPPHAMHYVIPDETKLYVRDNLQFYPEVLSVSGAAGIMSQLPKSASVIYPDRESFDTICTMFSLIHSEKNREVKESLTSAILLKISSILPEQPPAPVPEHIPKAIEVIIKGYNKKINTDLLAKELGVSRTKLFSDFKKYTSQTPGELILKLRMEESVKRLLRGESVAQTALSCGFSDSTHFLRTFKKHFGTTPTNFIQKHKIAF